MRRMFLTTAAAATLMAALPAWALSAPPAELEQILRDPTKRDQMRGHESILSAGKDWGRIVLFDNRFWPEFARRDLGSIAAERGQDVFLRRLARLAHFTLSVGRIGHGACRMHAAIYRNSAFGHVHTIETAPVPAIEPAEARSIGCLCRRDMDYINAKTAKLRWGQGWAYGLLFEDGTYHI